MCAPLLRAVMRMVVSSARISTRTVQGTAQFEHLKLSRTDIYYLITLTEYYARFWGFNFFLHAIHPIPQKPPSPMIDMYLRKLYN